MPLHEEIKSGEGKSGPRLERSPRAMQHLLQRTDLGQHRQHGRHQHASIPRATLTQLEIGRVAFFGMDAGITQDGLLLLKGFNQ